MKLLIAVVFCSLAAHSQAQQNWGQQFIKAHSHPLYVSMHIKGKKPGTPGATSIFEVIDRRPDTSRIGFCKGDYKRYEIMLKENICTSLAAYLNNTYTSPGENRSMLIIVKKLWLSDSLGMGGWMSKMVFRAEGFYKTPAGLLPIAYLDTTAIYHNGAGMLVRVKITDMFNAFMNRIALVHDTDLTYRERFYSLHAIDSMNLLPYHYPMDTVQMPAKGVYASLEEFKNNQPSITSYDIQSDENGLPCLYLKDETGKSYFSRNMWGCSDGQHCYVMMDGNLFPVLPAHHAFYVLGSFQYQRKTTVVPVLILIPGAMLWGMQPMKEKVIRNLSFYSLDAHTGLIY